MTAPRVFFDTNVLLYLLSDDATKSDRVEILTETGGITSVQVLNEFASVASRKLRMSWAEIRDILSTIRAVYAVEPVTIETHERALDLAERYRLSLYDALILAAASIADCVLVYSEDMQHGRVIEDRITIRNPFVSER